MHLYGKYAIIAYSLFGLCSRIAEVVTTFVEGTVMAYRPH